MSKDEILNIFHKQLRVDIEPQGFKREKTDYVVRHVSNYNEDGFISSSNINEVNAHEVIRSELKYFNEIGQCFEWKVYSYDQPANLLKILEAEGFEVEDREALMVMEINENHPFLNSSLPSNLREITSVQEIKELIQLAEMVFGESLSELEKRLCRDKQKNPLSLFLYGIYENEELVSAAWMYLENGTSFASFWGGATKQEARGKGYYSSLLKVRAQKAFEHGYRFMTVDALPTSQPILEKNGFDCLAYSYGCQSPKTRYFKDK
ncbi:GNAT family N-acetyltransferase [Halobacillus campisalis]|uniref:GNAT family N-acetyltransferase n=1 Tax=Halobacillus campisalis TaxID=435909 RepID=A0ABW2K3I0_9BACI|nr:GNAT family N-acetyltransferase [Halobacillus campisalis]